MGRVSREGGGCWKRATQTFSKTAGPFFSLCVSSDAHSWSFRLLGGGWETPTYTKQRSLLRCSKRGEGGLARGRDGWREVKRDVRKVIMSLCLKSAGASQSDCHYRHQLCGCVAAPPLWLTLWQHVANTGFYWNNMFSILHTHILQFLITAYVLNVAVDDSFSGLHWQQSVKYSWTWKRITLKGVAEQQCFVLPSELREHLGHFFYESSRLHRLCSDCALLLQAGLVI